MSRNDKYNYSKAAADLYDAGACDPDEVYEYHSEESFRRYVKGYGLNPDKYIKPEARKASNTKKNDGCYLTTACVVSKGLPDNCDELQTLRSFRDTYLASLPNGRAEIEQYYRIAPEVVASVNLQSNHEEIWDQVYRDLVVPCVRMIHAQENEKAYNHYKKYSMELYEGYAGNSRKAYLSLYRKVPSCPLR